jgi:hypothetical protein
MSSGLVAVIDLSTPDPGVLIYGTPFLYTER